MGTTTRIGDRGATVVVLARRAALIVSPPVLDSSPGWIQLCELELVRDGGLLPALKLRRSWTSNKHCKSERHKRNLFLVDQTNLNSLNENRRVKLCSVCRASLSTWNALCCRRVLLQEAPQQ
ncbi:hypothetical protein KCU88_g320, partial [Aureobasidium melanogenum]